MIGDIRLVMCRWWRQLWCHHVYVHHHLDLGPCQSFELYTCIKCGREKLKK
jgi:hypothetical protein